MRVPYNSVNYISWKLFSNIENILNIVSTVKMNRKRIFKFEVSVLKLFLIFFRKKEKDFPEAHDLEGWKTLECFQKVTDASINLYIQNVASQNESSFLEFHYAFQRAILKKCLEEKEKEVWERRNPYHLSQWF